MKTQSLPNPGQKIYEICVKGHLDHSRIDTLIEGITITHRPNGETIITGHLPDQSALYGLLNRLRDLGIPLLSVNCLNLPNSQD